VGEEEEVAFWCSAGYQTGDDPDGKKAGDVGRKGVLGIRTQMSEWTWRGGKVARLQQHGWGPSDWVAGQRALHAGSHISLPSWKWERHEKTGRNEACQGNAHRGDSCCTSTFPYCDGLHPARYPHAPLHPVRATKPKCSLQYLEYPRVYANTSKRTPKELEENKARNVSACYSWFPNGVVSR
jgi:hypothetical protein